MKDLKYLMAYTVPLSVVVSFYFGGVFSYTSLVYVFVFIPLVELLLPVQDVMFSENQVNTRLKNKMFDWLLYLNVPIVYVLLFYGLYVFATYSFDTYVYFGLILSLGILLATNAVNVAHELGHRKSKLEQTLTRLLLLPCLYMHFTIEHNRGHHKFVATAEDPATAKRGQVLYHFWLTSVLGQYTNAWRIQRTALKKSGVGFFSLHNKILLFTIYQILYLATVYMVFGLFPFLCAFVVGVISFLFLETINYIEHYGLVRKKIDGKYEKVQNIHSWNSDHIMGRIVLYELTRHSDHHYRASKKYQILESHKTSPRLPFGYPMSMLLALVPPLWFRVIHPKLKKMNS
jgi:alkane 1-monooxygenase